MERKSSRIPVKNWLQRLTGRLIVDRRGAIAVFMAAAIIPLIALCGLAIDTARGYLVKARLSQALDAAALAGGRVYFESRRDSDIQMFFDANFPADFLNATVAPLIIQHNDEAGTLTVSTSARIDTTFMRVLGFETMDVAVRTVVQRADRGMELVLVMDNTGSMKGSKITNMKTAARDLVSILYGQRQSIPNFWIGLVPYTAAVNVGAGYSSWLAAGSLAALNFGPNGWKGCVEARWGDGNDVTDATPAEAPFQPFHWARHPVDNDWPPVDETAATNTNNNYGRGPNLGCGPAITPLVAERSAVEAAINAMGPWHRGGTTTNLGAIWGWRVLSPKWRGLWGNPALPLDYDAPLSDKVAVILTDGDNQLYNSSASDFGVPSSDSDYSGYQRLSAGRLGTTNLDAARRELNERTSEVCANMKQEGIIIYTITFQVANNNRGQEIRQVFRNCATTPGHYFDSPDGATLRQVFKTIGSQLSNLRIAE